MSHSRKALNWILHMKLALPRLALGLVCASALAGETAALAPARALFESKRFPEARLAFEKLEAADPGNADIHYYLGQLAIERDDADAAVRELERSTALSPDSARGHNALGDAYGRSAQKAGMLGKFGLARKCLAEYERAVALEPGNVDFHESLFGYLAGAPSIVGGGIDKAASEAATISKLDPMRGHRAYAMVHTAGGKYDLALAELDEILRTEPDDYASLYQVGRIAAMSGQHFERGLASLRKCLALAAPEDTPPHSAAQWRIGNILEKEGNTAGARAAYEASLKLDPKFAQASDALSNLK
jgi:tetratricopeptide (TPR) repeat protein